MPSVIPVLVCVPNPMWDRIVKILAILPPVFQMHNVLFKMQFQCVDVCPVFNFCPFNGLASISMNANQVQVLADLEPFVRIPLGLLFVSAQRERVETLQEGVVLALLPKSADPIPNVEKAKLASLEKENAFVEEDMIAIVKLEGVKISMNVWPVPNLSVVLMLSAKICLEATNASAHRVTVATLLAGARNVLLEAVLVNLLMCLLATGASWLDALVTLTANQTKPNV